MASGATESMFVRGGVYEGCIGGCDWEVERRPYHRNCGCALHKLRGSCSHSITKKTIISYPMRRSWSEGCLSLSAEAPSPPSRLPSTVPAKADVRISRLGSFDMENDSWDRED